MPASEKLHLLWELWDSLASDESNIPVSEADKQEMRRRLALYNEGKLSTVSWDSARAEILGKRRS